MRFLKATMTILVAVTGLYGQTKYYGGVDLGSKGAKAALFSFVRGPEGKDAKVLDGQVINTKLVSSMDHGQFTPAGIEDASNAVKRLVEGMKASATKRGLSGVEYFIVGSSGVAKGKNKDALAASVKEATDIDMDFVDVKREAYFTLLSSVPKHRRPKSMVLDVGSGNTKMGCLVGGMELDSFRSGEIPFGSVSLRKLATELSREDIPAGVDQAIKDKVGPAYDKESMDTPCLRNRERIYASGGAVWATATFTHPEHALNTFVVLRKADVEKFLAHLKDGSWNHRATYYPFPKDMPPARQAEIRARAEKDRADVQNVFAREDLIAGVSILKVVMDTSDSRALFQFVRDGNFLYGYAREKFKEEDLGTR